MANPKKTRIHSSSSKATQDRMKNYYDRKSGKLKELEYFTIDECLKRAGLK
jgi:hypothetical protein